MVDYVIDYFKVAVNMTVDPENSLCVGNVVDGNTRTGTCRSRSLTYPDRSRPEVVDMERD